MKDNYKYKYSSEYESRLMIFLWWVLIFCIIGFIGCATVLVVIEYKEAKKIEQYKNERT